MDQPAADYLDGFVFSIPRVHLDTYRRVATAVAAIWREHGALAYREYVSEDPERPGTRSFADAVAARPDEVVVFDWVTFASRDARDRANARVAADPRMEALVAPLTDPASPVFDARRMVYGGFQPLVREGTT